MDVRSPLQLATAPMRPRCPLLEPSLRGSTLRSSAAEESLLPGPSSLAPCRAPPSSRRAPHPPSLSLARARRSQEYFSANATKRGLGIPLDNNFIVLDNGIGFSYTTDSAFVGPVYAKAVAAGKRVLVYEGDSDACGLQTAPIEDIFAPFFGNGTRRADQWTPVGPLNTNSSAPLRLRQTQAWLPFEVLPTGRKVQGGFSMAWADGQVTFVSIRGAGHLAPLYRPAA